MTVFLSLISSETCILNHLRRLPCIMKQKMIGLNLFENESARTPDVVFREILFTRVFIVTMALASTAIGFYSIFAEQNHLITVKRPSFTTYQGLYRDYSSTLACPCSKISMSPYTFLNITFSLRAICTSDMVSPASLNYIASLDTNLLPSWTETQFSRDFRAIGASCFQILATFCSLSKTHVEDARNRFIQSEFINDRLLAPPDFLQQTETLVESLLQATKNDFARTLDWIDLTFRINHFFAGDNMIYKMMMSDNGKVDVVAVPLAISISIDKENVSSISPCSCEYNYMSCIIIPLIYMNGSSYEHFIQRFSEIPISCLLSNRFLHSKVDWWYKRKYLENIQATYAMIIDSQPSPNPQALGPSVPSGFQNLTLFDFLDRILIKTGKQSKSNFDRFYHECAPVSCTFTKRQRRYFIVAFLLIISICAGIKQVLEIGIPILGKFMFICVQRWKNRAPGRGR